MSAQHVLNALAGGKAAMIRTEPMAETETDFDTKVQHHKGLVRFAFRDEPGEWRYPNKEYDAGVAIVGFGLTPPAA